jgi:signal transduction histidine kinase
MVILILSSDASDTLLEDIIGITFYSLAFSALPIAIGLAILRYRLWDIDLIINRTLVYGALTACVVGLYVLIVGGLGALFQTSGNLLISLFATAVVAVLFAPLRDRLQRGVNRLLYGQRDDPYAVLSRLGQRLEATLAPDAVLPAIVATIKEALKLPYTAIALDQEGQSIEVAAVGTPTPNPLCLPLSYQGETIGQLILAPRAPGETFTPVERLLLDDLAHQAGVAVAAVRLTADLQRSREGLVSAREEERRRLRRDLHDGLGPALAAHTLKVGSARALLSRNPAAADSLLAELEGDIQTALADIRRLVYNLRPPSLDELGLIGAIRETTARYSARENGVGPLQIVIEAPERLPALPAAVEVAAYRIVQKALTNVVRHAQAKSCHVQLSLGEESLGLEIRDDGVGLPPERQAGIGLTSMRERAQELGGTCQVETGPSGGVRVLARLPLPKNKN